MKEINFEVKEKFGVISDSNNKWKKELRLVSWNGREAKYDIREWSLDDNKMSKGITLTKDELLKLRDCIDKIVF